MNDVELAIRLTADADQAAGAMDDVGAAAKRMGDDVEAGTRAADAGAARLDGVAESADGVASKGAQAAGALSGLGDLVGGKFGAAMVVGGTAMQGFADAGDLVNVVTESAIVRKIKDTAVTVAQRTATVAAAVATRTMAVAQRVLNAAMRANPIGLAVTAALLLVGAFILLYRRSERFRAIVQAVMRGARAAIQAVWNVLKSVGSFVAGALAGYFRVLGAVARGVWNGIKVVVRVVVAAIRAYLNAYRVVAVAVWGVIKGAAVAAWNGIRNYVADKVNAIKSLAQGIRDRFRDVWQAVKSAGSGAIDAVIGPIQRAIDLVEGLLNKISHVHMPDLNPFNKRAALGRTSSTAGGVAASGGTDSGSVVININVTAGVGDPVAIASTIQSVLQRRNVYLGVA